MSEQDLELIFDIVCSIGHGGQADVYLVRLRTTGGFYAGKFLREAWDPLAREQFRREAERQERVGGTHVVPIIARNLDASKPFIVLEYMPHGSLADELQNRGRLPVRDALATARQVAIALADLHASGVVHRDLKPGNVLRAPDGALKLNDLGLAATMTYEEFVRAPGFVGTPAYAAPEQMLGLATAKTDVFALGVILYELVVGWPGPRTQLPSQLLGETARAVDHLVLVMTAAEQFLRPTAAEAVRLLEEAIRSISVATPKPAPQAPSVVIPSRSGTSAPASSSNPLGWLLGGAALFGTIALLAGGGSSWDSSVGRYRGRDGKFRSG